MSLPQPFAYPVVFHTRKHAPAGYTTYQAFKDWLRDEFDFRCVYCLQRETWSRTGAALFSVDHIFPQGFDPHSLHVCEYSNLVYACNQCNSCRQNEFVLDPTREGIGEHLRVNLEDGTVTGLTWSGRFMIELMHLNAEKVVRERLRILRLLRRWVRYNHDADVRRDFFEAFGYPPDLPDLRRRPPHGPNPPAGNALAANTEHCAYARRERGDLPLVYSVGDCPRLIETV